MEGNEYVIEKADNLMSEMDTCGELGNSLMEWLLGKYKAQEEITE